MLRSNLELFKLKVKIKLNNFETKKMLYTNSFSKKTYI